VEGVIHRSLKNLIQSPVTNILHEQRGENFEFKLYDVNAKFNELSGNYTKIDQDKFYSILHEFLSKHHYPAGSSSRYPDEIKNGIMSGHAFALLEVEKVHIFGEDQRVVKMFNP
jgi:hypothetical protein